MLGRKGSGKTALFLALRDRKRRDQQNVVIDLRPEGYKLLRVKEKGSCYSSVGEPDHVVTPVWDYILTAEIAHAIIKTDRLRYKNGRRLYELYLNIKSCIRDKSYSTVGDFAERLANLLSAIARDIAEFAAARDDKETSRYSSPQISERVYKKPLAELRGMGTEYIRFKSEVWRLIDNIDKGWPSAGVTVEDGRIIKSLSEAIDKTRRDFDRRDIAVFPLLCLRDDVYRLVIKAQPDRGRVTSASTDWDDAESLKQLLVKRLRYAGSPKEDDFRDRLGEVLRAQNWGCALVRSIYWRIRCSGRDFCSPR